MALFLVFSLFFSADKANSLSVSDHLQASLLDLDLISGLAKKEIHGPIQSNDLFVGLTDSQPKESPDLFLVQENSLVAFSPPSIITAKTLGDIVGEEEDEFPSSREGIIEYTVEQGDTLAGIAEKFDISLDTLLWTNNLSKSSKLKLGQSLIILPVSGTAHYVKKGDTLSGIAKTYKGEADAIIAFNDLAAESDIYIGDILIIPNGKMPPKQSVASGPIASSSQIPVASSYFICPVAGSCSLTQGLHWHNAVDFASKCDSPIYAAAGGQIQRVRYGWNGGAGNYVTVLHPNGVVTLYGHVVAGLVSPGEQVSQGQVIALTGGRPGTPGAGISTGCHVHFEVRGGKNPFVR